MAKVVYIFSDRLATVSPDYIYGVIRGVYGVSHPTAVGGSKDSRPFGLVFRTPNGFTATLHLRKTTVWP